MILGRLWRRGQSADALLALANDHLASGDFLACKERCSELLQQTPDNAHAVDLIGQAEWKTTGAAGAIPHFEQAIRIDPKRGPTWLRLADAQRVTGDRPAAQATLQRRCESAPDDLDAWMALSTLFADASELAAAEHVLERCVAANPDDGRAHTRLGIVRMQQANWAGAKAAFETTLAHEPESVTASRHLAFILEIAGEIGPAVLLLEQAISFGGGDADVFLQAARVARRSGDAARAIEFARQALECDDTRADAHYQLGCALWDKGDVDGAGDAFQATIDRDPENACARWAFAMTALPSTQIEDGEDIARRFADRLEFLERWLTDERARKAFDALGAFTAFFLAYVERDNHVLLARYGDLCERVMRAYVASPEKCETASRTTTGVIRVGIVSGHLFDHSVWHAIIKGWFLHLNKSIVSLHAYALKTVVDAETSIAKLHAEKFVQLGSRDQDVWAQAIADDNLDVIVFPEIGMNGIALQLACRRLAPIQIAAWGHPETTGLPEIDYFLSGEDFEPRDAQAFYREKLIPLAHLGVFYEPPGEGEPLPIGHPRDNGERAPFSDAELSKFGIAPHRPILLCPGTPFKYPPHHDNLYVELASRVSAAQLVFFDDGRSEIGVHLRNRLTKSFAAAGMDFDEHVIVVPWLTPGQWRGLLDRATAVLDTAGFSGFNTAAQALAADVPVVAWEGKFLRGRLASGLLRRMDLREWIARDTLEFVDRVARLCDDGDLRKRVAARIAVSKCRAFGDIEPVRDLERFFVDKVRR